MSIASQINSIRDQNFAPINLRKCMILNDGKFSKIKSSFFLEDAVENRKILLEKNNNILKAKFILINDISIANLLIESTDLLSIESIILKNKLIYKDVDVTTGFYGSRGGLEHLINETNKYELRYDVFFDVQNKFLQKSTWIIGFLFYDYKLLAVQTNVPVDKINKSLILGPLFSFDIKRENDEDNIGNVNIHLLKTILNSADKLYEKSEDPKKLKLHKNNKVVLQKQNFVTDIFDSIDENGNLNFIFAFDYKNLILKNSLKSNIIKNLDNKFILETSNILSLKIIRREYEKKGKSPGKFIIKNKPYVSLISTSQDFSSDEINDYEDNNARISEVDLFKNLKTIEVVDKKAYRTTPTYYQYGMELLLNDTFDSYVKSQRDKLLQNKNILNSYLQDMQNIVNFNFNLDRATNYFIDKVYPKKYEFNLSDVIADFVISLEIVGLIRPGKSQILLKNTIENILNPELTDDSLISYFINLYDKVLNIFNNQLSFSVENTTKNIFWFKKIVDTKDRPTYGYGYLSEENQNGLLEIESNVLDSKFSTDITQFCKEQTSKNIIPYALSPSYVKIAGERIIFSEFSNNSYTNIINKIPDKKYIDMELDVKNYINSDNIVDSPSVDLDMSEQNMFSSVEKINKIIQKNSPFSVTNFYKDEDDSTSILNKGLESLQPMNKNLNPDIFLLSMLKSRVEEKKVISSTQTVPVQVESLLNKTDNIFSPLKIDYLTDLNYNSKFLFLYNTICVIEYIDNSFKTIDQIKINSWKNLTKSFLTTIMAKERFLCRLKLYVNPYNKINGFNHITMPIFDKYFILTRSMPEARKLERDNKIKAKRSIKTKRDIKHSSSIEEKTKSLRSNINISSKKSRNTNKFFGNIEQSDLSQVKLSNNQFEDMNIKNIPNSNITATFEEQPVFSSMQEKMLFEQEKISIEKRNENLKIDKNMF